MFTTYLRKIIRLVKENDGFFKPENFKWSAAEGVAPLDFFWHIFLVKNALTVRFRIDIGVRFLILLCVNSLTFYIFWSSFDLLFELFYSLVEYNFSNNFFSAFFKHSHAADNLLVLYTVIDPIEFFWWYICLAIFFFNFSRFDDIFLQRYRRVEFTINFTMVVLCLLSILLFFVEYDYFRVLLGGWIGCVEADISYYGTTGELGKIIPFASGLYTLQRAQITLFFMSYAALLAILFVLPHARTIYYYIKGAVHNCYVLAIRSLKIKYARALINSVFVYLVFKIIKLFIILSYVANAIFNAFQILVLDDSLGVVFSGNGDYKLYIILLTAFSFVLSFISAGSLGVVFWLSMLYFLVFKLDLTPLAKGYTVFLEVPSTIPVSLPPLTWLFILFLIATILTAILVFACLVVGPRKNHSEKVEAYECGFHALGNPRENFSVNFFLLAVLFLIFDLEIVFVMPLVAKFEGLVFVEFVTGILFIFFLFLGFIYEWRRNALNL